MNKSPILKRTYFIDLFTEKKDTTNQLFFFLEEEKEKKPQICFIYDFYLPDAPNAFSYFSLVLVSNISEDCS